MKKTVVLVLCFALIMVSCIPSFAQEEKPVQEGKRLQLQISDETSDLETMKKTDLSKFLSKESVLNEKNGNSIFTEENYLELVINDSEKSKDYNLISGQGRIKAGDIEKSLNFEDVKFKVLKDQNGNVFSYGCIEVLLPEIEETLLIDVVEMNDFSKVIATTSCGTLENGTGVLFWGNMFEEYDDFYALQIESLNNPNVVVAEENTENSRAGRKYDYVGKAKSASVSGGSGSGTTVIVVVGKRDFRDGNATNGYEMIRVFSKTGNAKSYIDGATSAYAIEANVDFKCTTENLLDVSDVSPKNTSSTMPRAFEFLSQLHPSVGATIAAINLVGYNQIGSVNYTINSTDGFSFDNHANIKIDTSTMSSSTMNLPSDISYDEAQTDTSHGACGEIQYQKYMNVSSGSVTAKGRIKYRFYYSTHRYTSAYTSYASKTHTIYNN